MAIEIIKLNSDSRGDMYGFNIGDRQHRLVTFKAGIPRGGHCHATDQWHICIAGEFDVALHNIDTGEEWVERITEGQSILIKARVAHLITPLVDSVLAESRLGDYEATDYEPFRKLARPQ